jgi:hypothetical protein
MSTTKRLVGDELWRIVEPLLPIEPSKAHTYFTYIIYIYNPFVVHFEGKVIRAKWIGDGYNASRGLYRRQTQSSTD